jgi:2-keto-4-pentenoate hydratase/2-oxohepta-3-ene-1,7-dioic acid hydratase in catechol pathway
MKLVTFTQGKKPPAIGALLNDGTRVLPLRAASEMLDRNPPPYFTDMLAFLQAGAAAHDKAQALIAAAASGQAAEAILERAALTLLAPLPRPESIRDCMAFEQHIINCIRTAGLKKLAPLDTWIECTFGRRRSLAFRLNRAWYERPIYYKGNRFSVIGPEAAVAIPAFTRRMDYELEWGIYIGRVGREIPENKAREYIGGYTVFNDFSARDIQLREQGGRLGPAKGKDFDGGNAMGPCLVTPDEIPDPYALAMTARVNGQEWSRGTTADMHWTFEAIISYISRGETLHPGEFIGSGTCSGAQGKGCGLEMNRFLQAGDVVELEVEKIGCLRNQLTAQ